MSGGVTAVCGQMLNQAQFTNGQWTGHMLQILKGYFIHIYNDTHHHAVQKTYNFISCMEHNTTEV